MERQIYFDHAATTPVRKEVLEEMLPYFTEQYGNPSSVYKLGRKSQQSVDMARWKIAKAIGAQNDEIYFTGGGSEADNWALKGAAWAKRQRGNHIITSSIEHHGILNTCEWLEKNGFEVTYLPVDAYGRVRLGDVRNAITEKTILVSIMMANNEVGTLQPIQEITKICKEKGILVHTDAVQALGSIPVDVKELGIDLLSMSSHKIYGPKGVGALFIRKGVQIQPLIHGGSQERKRRAGTENVPGIVGFGKATELAVEELPAFSEKMHRLRKMLLSGVAEKIGGVQLNGHPEERLPGNINLAFEEVDGEALLVHLDMENICCSSGSACTAGSLDPSHVLLAMDVPREIAQGSLRITFGKDSTEEEIEYFLDKLSPIVEKLRNLTAISKASSKK